MRVAGVIGAALLEQRGHLFAWTPVLLGAGIGLYFVLWQEPGGMAVALLAALGGGAALGALRIGPAYAPLLWAVLLVVAGMVLGLGRSMVVQAPVLGWRYYGPVEGTVVGIDRSASDKLRLTLGDVALDRVPPVRTPGRVRVSLHGAQGYITPEPGMRVILTGHLSPPAGPVEPGGFDFQRHAWFQGLGAVGYTRTPVLQLAPPDGAQRVFALRMRMSRAIRARFEGARGGFAAAVTTGDRSGIPMEVIEALRVSNLAHLLAISGLHMGLLAGFVFAALRVGMALIPFLALRLPARKMAAAGSLMAAAVYLLLSGGSVATQRAFVMAAVALFAVMVDRRAISLRAVAIAALIVLLLRPEAVLSPGFQMSFAATTALVAAFGALRGREGWLGPRWVRPAMAVVISSAVAGAATAPFGAAHFNHVAPYGLLANLLAVPVMGTVVIPAAVLAACLLPLGLEGVGLWIMGQGLGWILGVADWVAGLEGARVAVPKPSGAVLPLVSLGMLGVFLWQGRWRFAGVLPVAVGLALWVQADRPVALVSRDGALVGVMTEAGRALSKPRGAGFVARIWLENDGDGADQQEAAARWRGEEDSGLRRVDLGGVTLVHATGRRAAEAINTCAPGQIVVLPVARDNLPGGCEILDSGRLRRTGAVAFHSGEEGTLQRVTARRAGSARPWTAGQ
ncbi:competence protein ComEC [Salinihabitans flavidus]|uniref:Competence protein ComEC n=1 Tax=Salinihabitans flavidus TaxID=569882 RepID=A0A1H8TW99_9RHOB|nr:ComEC/Rec2 family competence protein [Salinihabitans flavidus]SEO95279.1 competence protein ComEC [Salinihabitans flavidus]